MKTIRISDEAYELLHKMAKAQKRTLIATLDRFIEMFKEELDESLASKSLQDTKG